MTWANGRSLTRAESYAGTVDFAYDLNGLRRSKTVGEVVHNYLYAGGKLLRETYGTNTLDFFYDASGMPYALKHNGSVYYYITNLRGDVMLLVDADGNTVASYEYDPYGKVISATGSMAEINPIRYRGYYHDSETGFYYLQSRYYDPTTCRFINADSYSSTGQGIIGHNMFAYCLNSPVTTIDATGKRTYFINGIHNKEKEDAPEYAEKISKLLNEKGEQTTAVPVYNGQDGLLGYVVGFCEVVCEMANQYIYTMDVVNFIQEDLTNNPLAEGESINLIGYSGGGQIVLNVMELMPDQIDNVILIGTPVMEMFSTNTHITMLYSMGDVLSWNCGFGFDAYCVGKYGHGGYFNSENVNQTADLLYSILAN